MVFPIVLFVNSNLGSPELFPGSRPFKQMAFVSVPETSTDKYNRLVFPENKIGFTRQGPVMQAKPESPFAEGFLSEARALYFSLYPGHHSASDSCRNNICHGLICRNHGFLFRLRYISVMREPEYMRQHVFATTSTTGTTTAFPNCLYACVSETGILNLSRPG